MKELALAAAVSLFSLAGCTTPEPDGPCDGTFTDEVTRIVDGDTLDVAKCGRIRLALVDTPERGEQGYSEATNFTRALCPVGLEALVDLDAGQPMDTTGTRLVAVVYCGGKNLNAALLENGHALILEEFCERSEFADDGWARASCAP